MKQVKVARKQVKKYGVSNLCICGRVTEDPFSDFCFRCIAKYGGTLKKIKAGVYDKELTWQEDH